ncbi:MAG: methyltransferase domain-containing protein [Candidatus Schekmanbacteria bacterium]|nr:methyltransferase domain-containing protein [Candidatus Schekmanbacteria bacterium]
MDDETHIMFENIFADLFTPEEIEKRKNLWKILCRDFFEKFIKKDDVVLDLGAGYCEFINNVRCGKKYAVDQHTHPQKYANSDVKVIISNSSSITEIEDESIDVVFVSNFWEHMRDRDELKATLREVRRMMKKDGRLIVLQPNIRYCYKLYWDFFDHVIPLSHKSMEEILKFMGFRIEYLKPKFLPYSTKSRYPKHPFFVKTYLKLPFLHYIFGKQMVVVAGKR